MALRFFKRALIFSFIISPNPDKPEKKIYHEIKTIPNPYKKDHEILVFVIVFIFLPLKITDISNLQNVAKVLD